MSYHYYYYCNFKHNTDFYVLTSNPTTQDTNCVAESFDIVIKTPALLPASVLPQSTVGVDHVTKEDRTGKKTQRFDGYVLNTVGEGSFVVGHTPEMATKRTGE